MIGSIFAVDAKNGIALNGTLPWPRNKEDLKFFKDTTLNQIVVMGRKTWDDPNFPKPLPNRTNVILSSNLIELVPSVIVIRNLEFLERFVYNQEKDIWIIGGRQILEATKYLVTKILVTKFKEEFKCDTYIDIDKYLSGFKLVDKKEKELFSIETYSKGA